MDGEGDDKAKFESNVTLVQVPQLVEQGRKNWNRFFKGLTEFESIEISNFGYFYQVHLS